MPVAVAGLGPGRVVVTQPRRIAVRAATRRLAQLLGEPVGGTAGYTVRDDRRTGPGTLIEFVTTGVLLRRLHRDPELPGVAAVVLDEVHERRLDADLALALLVDVRRHLREDLVLVAMSATVEADRTAALLAPGGAPVIRIPGALHPVEVRWSPPRPGVRALDDRGVTPGFLDHVAACTRSALAEQDGDVLVFLPGVREVTAVVSRLAGNGVAVLPLHGRLAPQDQDRALAAGAGRRVVVATAVAETSLTVPGVRAVVDAGLSREPRTDHRRGLAGLVTVRVSRAAAEQRSGRAGREGPGVVLRCWSEAEHPHLPAHPAPEIAVADLVGLALELAVWGVPTPQGWPCSTRRRRQRSRRPGRRSSTSAPWTSTVRSLPAAGPSPRSRPTRGWGGRCSTAPCSSVRGGPPRWWRCSPRTSAPPAATWWPGCVRCAAVARGAAPGGLPSADSPRRCHAGRPRGTTGGSPMTWPSGRWSRWPTPTGWPGVGRAARRT